ncbi:MAG: hypothetical protein IJY13_03080 [Clostridia bacterium]|nr:hypothetical protein [Clostridia bacterium]
MSKLIVERAINLPLKVAEFRAVKLVVNWKIYLEPLGKKSQKFYLIDINFLHQNRRLVTLEFY